MIGGMLKCLLSFHNPWERPACVVAAQKKLRRLQPGSAAPLACALRT